MRVSSALIMGSVRATMLAPGHLFAAGPRNPPVFWRSNPCPIEDCGDSAQPEEIGVSAETSDCTADDRRDNRASTEWLARVNVREVNFYFWHGDRCERVAQCVRVVRVCARVDHDGAPTIAGSMDRIDERAF